MLTVRGTIGPPAKTVWRWPAALPACRHSLVHVLQLEPEWIHDQVFWTGTGSGSGFAGSSWIRLKPGPDPVLKPDIRIYIRILSRIHWIWQTGSGSRSGSGSSFNWTDLAIEIAKHLFKYFLYFWEWSWCPSLHLPWDAAHYLNLTLWSAWCPIWLAQLYKPNNTSVFRNNCKN